MKAIINLSEVAEDLAECQPGEEVMLTLTVTENDGQTLKGDATAVEKNYGEDSEEEMDEEYEEEMPMERKGMKKKMPKAILLVAGK